MSKNKKRVIDSDIDDINFLKDFAVNNVSSGLTLEEEEYAANALLREAFAKSKRYQEEHKFDLPDHLEQFRKDYEKSEKVRVSLPVMSSLSPRTRRELSLLPKPTAFEEQKIKTLVDQSKSDKNTLYGKLTQQHQPAQEASPTRLSSIANSTMVLIPSNAHRDVNNDSTHYYETMEYAKKRKQEQDDKLAKLFNKYNNDTTATGNMEERVKTTSRNSKRKAASTATVASPIRKMQQQPSRGLPKLLLPPSMLPTLETNDHTGSSALVKPSALAKAGAISLSKSLTSLPPRQKSPMSEQSVPFISPLGEQSVASSSGSNSSSSGLCKYKPLSPTPKHTTGSATNIHSNSITTPLTPTAPTTNTITTTAPYKLIASIDNNNNEDSQDPDILHARNTPLLYSLFKSNPIYNERNIRYSKTGMLELLAKKYTQENNTYIKNNQKLKKKSEKEYLNLFSVQVYKDTGLDLNKEYNKINNYTIYLMKLSYYFYIQKLKNGFMHYYSQYLKIKKERIQQASKIIFRSVKFGVYILTKNEKKRRYIEQQKFERQRQLELDTVYYNKCKLLFRTLFYYQKMKIIRRLVLHRKSATMIQKHVRARIGRRRAVEWYHRRKLINYSALVMQCAYRQRLARRKVILARKLHHVQLLLQHLQTCHAAHQQHILHTGAEIYIAKAYRTLKFRQKLKTLIYWNHHRCALLIQRVYKGYRTRKQFLILWNIHKNNENIKKRNAIIIQCCIRIYLAKKKLYNKLRNKYMLVNRRKQEKLLKLATGTHKFNIKWLFIKLYRKTQYFRIYKLNKKAIIIQKTWRGYYGRKRAFIVRVLNTLRVINDAFSLRNKQAIRIQRHWRGYITRLNVLRKRQHNLIIRIQTLWRLLYAKKRVRRIKKHRFDGIKLINIMKRLISRFRFRKRYKWQCRHLPYIICIQKYWRCAYKRRCMYRLLSSQRQYSETQEYIVIRINQILASVQLQILRETMLVPIGNRSKIYSSEPCFCLNPLQAVFTMLACNKGRTDSIALITNKADAQNILKLLLKINNVMENSSDNTATATSSTNNTKTNSPKKKKIKKINPLTNNLSLFLEYDADRMYVPSIQRKLKANHIDIMFNRAKTEMGNLLSYMDFLEFLWLIAEAQYNSTSSSGGGGNGNKDRQDEDDPNVITTVTTAANTNPTTSTTAMNTSTNSITTTTAPSFPKGHRKAANNLTLEKLKCSPKLLFAAPSTTTTSATAAVPDYRMALVLNIISSLRCEEFMSSILDWLHREAIARTNVFIIKIQAQLRKYFTKKIIITLKKKRAEDNIYITQYKYIIRIQALLRMFIYRYRLARLAQKTILQYNPYFGEVYWFNPYTRVRSYIKPKVLRSLDAYSIALPEEGLENIVNCSYCASTAHVNCEECEDSFCRVCYASMHCKGARATHRSYKIPKCSYCKFQVATKSCLTCVVKPPLRGHISESISEADRGMYCDTCFTYIHDQNEKALSIHKQRRKGLKNILAYSSQAYLLSQYIQTKPIIMNNHIYDNIIQTCEECQYRSSTWRCIDCNQLYCNICLISLHSIHINCRFSHHKAELLPYFTPTMYENFKKDINQQIFQTKLEKLMKIDKIKYNKKIYTLITKIQAWWRGFIYGKKGRQEMKNKRKKLRYLYRAYKNDTIHKRQNIIYKIKNYLGYSEGLHSDTKRDRIINRVNIWNKHIAMEFIENNMEDWGFYRISHKNPRKGMPKTGFNVGTIEELTDQAQYGGYRLPGKVILMPGEQEFTTTCDLTNILRVGEYVRIKRRLFGVIDVTATTIKVNRFWYAGAKENNQLAEEGEVLYRIPMYQTEPRKLEYRVKYLSYIAALQNPVSQGSLAVYQYYLKTMMRFALYMIRSNRRNYMREEEQAWRQASIQYADRIRHIQSLFPPPPTPPSTTTKPFISLYNTIKIPPRKNVLEEDSFSHSMKMKKTHAQKGLFEEFSKKYNHQQHSSTSRYGNKNSSGDRYSENEEEILFYPDGEDSVHSKDSWDQPIATPTDNNTMTATGNIRPKSASKKFNKMIKNNKIIPTAASEPSDVLIPSIPMETSNDDNNGVQSSDQMSKKVYNNKEEKKEIELLANKLQEKERNEISLPKMAGDINTILAEKRKEKELKKKKRLEKPVEPWYASAEQLDMRAEREDKMSLLELSLEAEEWRECIDIMTENVYYQNVKTNELFTTIPRAVAAKRQLDFENSKNKKNYDEAQKRISRMEDMIKNRKLITGGKKK